MRPIMVLYSSIDTRSRFSKSMSYCWPSITWMAVRSNMSRTLSRYLWGTLLMRRMESVYMASPDRMAVSCPHFFHTVSLPRRRGLLSIMSS